MPNNNTDIFEALEARKDMINAAIEKYIPKEISEEYLEFLLGPAQNKYSPGAVQKAIIDPIWDLLDRGGKRWRPAVFLILSEALGGDPKKLADFAIIPEVVHNGTLMADDVEDGSNLRRGKPCTHMLFGVDVAINAAEAMYFIPTIVFRKNLNGFDAKTILRAYNVFCEELTKLTVSGQAVDIYWHKDPLRAKNVTEAQYLQMCAGKTGALARMSARLASVLCGGNEEQELIFGRLSETIGVAFQIHDDILNLTAKSGKGQFVKEYIGSDITEGKVTLMVIYALTKASENDKERLLHIISMHTSDKALISEAIKILEKSGAIGYANSRAKQLVADAWSSAEPLLKESNAKKQLKALAEYLVKRDV